MSDMAVSDPGSPSADAVNDLFDYDVGLDDMVFPDNATSNAPVSKPPTQDPSGLGLGLDEEVTVTKKRQPVAKLDEGRLLSQRGIPKLRHTAKHKLKSKGKGHEFSDAARLLNFYQLWLDDLFPRAKFADGLAMIEKLGHSKRIQTMRREWIDEEKPRLFDEDPVPEAPKSGELPSENVDATGPSVAATGQPHQDRPFQQTHSEEGTAHRELFIPDPTKDTRPTTSHPEPEDDDLDDLLREQDEAMDDVAPPNLSESMSQAPDRGHDNYDAEYEVMQELGI